MDICLNINTNWVDDDHKVNALGHEVGHLYGLNDQYNHNTNACNPTENTVMDGDSGTGPCDSGYPTDSDATRVAQYFEYGGFVEFSTTIRQNAATVSWSDDAWAEKDHVTWAAYRLSPTHDWVPFGRIDKTAYVGQHRNMPIIPLKRHKMEIDLTKHQKDNPGVVLPPVSQYAVCGRVTNAQYGPGTTACADVTDVSNTDYNNSLPTPTPTATPTPTPTRVSGFNNRPGQGPPSVQIAASNLSPASGETVTLTAETTGISRPQDILFSWWSKSPSGRRWRTISGRQNSIDQSRQSGSRQYQVSFNHNRSVITSEPITITWQAAPTLTPIETPVPTPAETPVPTPTETPVPTPTETPVPTPIETPVPTPTPTPSISFSLSSVEQGQTVYIRSRNIEDGIRVQIDLSWRFSTNENVQCPNLRDDSVKAIWNTTTPVDERVRACWDGDAYVNMSRNGSVIASDTITIEPRDEPPTATPTPTGELSVSRTSLRVGQTTRIRAEWANPSDLDLRFIFDTDYLTTYDSCSDRSSGQGITERFIAPASLTLRACQTGSTTVKLKIIGGAVLDSESVSISAAYTPTPTKTAVPPTATPTNTPRPTGDMSVSRTSLRVGQTTRIRAEWANPSDLDLRFIFDTDYLTTYDSCSDRSSGQGITERFIAPASLTLRACQTGSTTVKLKIIGGAVLDSESVSISAAYTPTPTKTPRPNTPTPTNTPTPPTPTIAPTPFDCNWLPPWHPACRTRQGDEEEGRSSRGADGMES